MKPILVVGGAGYIGSHMVALLQEQKLPCVVLDDLSAGHRDAISDEVPFYQGDYADHAVLAAILQQHEFASVIHFGGLIQVGESMQQPWRYYQHNTAKSLSLLGFLLENNIKRFVFSSTAAVYGDPRCELIDEDCQKQPINPYGQSKWMIEQILADMAQANDFQSVSLRYFNAAGAHPDGHLAERHEPETHLIPLLMQTALKQRHDFTIFGNQYPTPDGTCVRDFIHVMDLASAHLAALDYLQKGGETVALNVGTGQGYSVKQVVERFQAVCGLELPIRSAKPRMGDPAYLVAATNKIRNLLAWQPACSDLETILRTAWLSQQRRSV